MYGEKPGSSAKSCAGITYFTSAMKAKGRPPLCVGRRGTLARDVSYKEVIERSAKSSEQKGPVEFTYSCIGYSQTTLKMEREGRLPLCDIGMRLMVVRAAQPVQQVARQQPGPQSPPDAHPMYFDVKAWLIRVGTSVLNFWRKSLDDFPNKWVAFNQRFVVMMQRQANFIAKMLNKVTHDALNWWLSKP